MGKRKTIVEVDSEAEANMAQLKKARELARSGRYDEASAILDDCRRVQTRIRRWINAQPENRVAA